MCNGRKVRVESVGAIIWKNMLFYRECLTKGIIDDLLRGNEVSKKAKLFLVIYFVYSFLLYIFFCIFLLYVLYISTITTYLHYFMYV